MVDFHTTAAGRRIAYDLTPGRGREAPGVVFLHGFRSDRHGTKAMAVDAWCRAHGRALLRFDLSGHGDSGADYPRFGLADWLDDACDIIGALMPGPAVLVGSSLGGWLALLMARDRPDRWAGLVTVAAAPDFTARLLDGMTDAERAAFAQTSALRRSSEYGGEDVFSRVPLEQGTQNEVLRAALHLAMPTRFLQGTEDQDVPAAVALALMDHASGPDIRLTLVKGGDHRLSSPADLALLTASVAELCGRSAEK